MEPLKIKDNPIKLELTGYDMQNRSTRNKQYRGEKTKIDVNAFDGYGFRQLDFNGVCYTKEDALRMADFFKVHAYCLRSEKDQ
jgi:hypothetical protein